MKSTDVTLMYVTDDRITDDMSFFSILEAALKGGITMVQLREKQLATRPFFSRAQQVKSMCKTYDVPLVINDRIDIALAVDADGVHLGQTDMPVSIARTILGKDKIIGLSVSNLEHTLEANTMPVDYIGISPIFSTLTKTKDLEPPLGIDGLRTIREATTIPIVCIGGVDKTNASQVIQNGAEGIAVISAISKGENPELETKTLKHILC